ncbi:hypothetical protein BN1708_019798, partial [Verticillium longisporum]
HVDH